MMSEILEFHAHVYFDKESFEHAKSILEAARDRFEIAMGHMHAKPVGPHPCGSCQLTVPAEKIGDVISWFSLNREGLTLFIHPDTGNHLADHTNHAIWMGKMLELDVSMFA